MTTVNQYPVQSGSSNGIETSTMNVPAGYPYCYKVHRYLDVEESTRLGKRCSIESVDVEVLYDFAVQSTRSNGNTLTAVHQFYHVFENEDGELIAVRITNELMEHNAQYRKQQEGL